MTADAAVYDLAAERARRRPDHRAAAMQRHPAGRRLTPQAALELVTHDPGFLPHLYRGGYGSSNVAHAVAVATLATFRDYAWSACGRSTCDLRTPADNAAPCLHCFPPHPHHPRTG